MEPNLAVSMKSRHCEGRALMAIHGRVNGSNECTQAFELQILGCSVYDAGQPCRHQAAGPLTAGGG